MRCEAGGSAYASSRFYRVHAAVLKGQYCLCAGELGYRLGAL